MKDLLDAFWRAAAYCLHPRVIALSILPLLLAGGLTLGLGWMYWELAVAGVRGTLEGWDLVATFLSWVESIGGAGFRTVIAPLIVVALAVPLIVVMSLLFVATLMTPAIASLVAQRRFAALERRRGAGWWQSAFWSLLCTLLALVALVASIPLWFVPPLVLVLPPLIWGWLTYRVMSFDVLAEFADAGERRQVLREHRWPLLGIGIVCGYLGAAPSLVWAVGAATLIFAPLLVVVSIWLYTLVFAFAALWFAHYALAALQRLRASREPPAPPPAAAMPELLPGGPKPTPDFHAIPL